MLEEATYLRILFLLRLLTGFVTLVAASHGWWGEIRDARFMDR